MGKSCPSPAIVAGTASVTSVYSSHFFRTEYAMMLFPSYTLVSPHQLVGTPIFSTKTTRLIDNIY